MAEVTATDVRRQFHSILKSAVDGTITTVTRHGKVLAAVIGASDYELLKRAKLVGVNPMSGPAPRNITPPSFDANGSPQD